MEMERMIDKRVRELDQLTEMAEASLRGAPEGSLQICRTDRRVQFYHNTGSGNVRYLGKSEKERIRDLAQKDYEQKVRASAEEERRFLEKMKARYPGRTPEKVYGELDPVRQELVAPVILSDEQFIREWQERKYTPKPFRDGDIYFHTERGERVRSKSEVIIANLLTSAGVPYLYECPLELKDGTLLHPDFTVLNIRKRKTMIWEHLGMMDDESYCQKALNRILLLEREGYFPGENLILTHETSRNPLDIRLVKKLIRCYLL